MEVVVFRLSYLRKAYGVENVDKVNIAGTVDLGEVHGLKTKALPALALKGKTHLPAAHYGRQLQKVAHHHKLPCELRLQQPQT